MKDIKRKVYEPKHFEKMNVSQYREMVGLDAPNSKFNNSRCVSDDGIKFQSGREMKRYYELRLLQRNRQIGDLQLQPRFLLQDGFKLDGIKYRSIEYVADFMYCDMQTLKYIVEDAKGFKTDVYKLKKKMFLAKYMDIYIFREV